MRNTLYIGEFARLNRLSVKTVIHYHRVGLLPEPPRTPAGYRLYGTEEMKRLLLIRRLKSLGLNLKQIGSLVADAEAGGLLKDYLQSREYELIAQIAALESQLASVRMMLTQQGVQLTESLEDPPSYRLVAEALGSQLYDACPELARQEKSLCEILDGFEWDMEYEQPLNELTAYFKDNPEQFQPFIDLGMRMQELASVPEDSPLIVELAADYMDALLALPITEALKQTSEQNHPFSGLMEEMVRDSLAPAQVRFLQLCGEIIEKRGVEK